MSKGRRVYTLTVKGKEQALNIAIEGIKENLREIADYLESLVILIAELKEHGCFVEAE